MVYVDEYGFLDTFAVKSPISESILDSSSSPISSKWFTSERISSLSDWYEEWNEEDLEDLDAANSGGEPGIDVG